MGKFGGDDLQQLKEHFNGLIDDQSSLGDALHGDLDDFRLLISELDEGAKKTLTDELIRVEIFDPDNWNALLDTTLNLLHLKAFAIVLYSRISFCSPSLDKYKCQTFSRNK